MSCAEVRAVLLGEVESAPVDDHLATCAGCRALADDLAMIDALAGELPERAPSPEVEARTLAAMDRLVARARRPWRFAALVGLAATALLAVVALPHADVAEPGTLVPRGIGQALPEVALKVAVEHGGSLERLRRGQPYAPGDTLYFRVQVDRAGWVALVRVDARGARLIHAQQLSPGETDLTLHGRPLGWQLDVSDDATVFVVLTAPLPLESAQVEDALGASYDANEPQAVCRAAASLGARCASAPIRVAP